MVEREDRAPLVERLRSSLLKTIEELRNTKDPPPSPEELDEAKEAADYVFELLTPTLEALERREYLDCVRRLDSVSLDVARQGAGNLVNITANAVSSANRTTQHADLIKGWANR